MKINLKDIVQIKVCETNTALTEIVLTNNCSVFIESDKNQFCISVNKTSECSEVWIEE